MVRKSWKIAKRGEVNDQSFLYSCKSGAAQIHGDQLQWSIISWNTKVQAKLTLFDKNNFFLFYLSIFSSVQFAQWHVNYSREWYTIMMYTNLQRIVHNIVIWKNTESLCTFKFPSSSQSISKSNHGLPSYVWHHRRWLHCSRTTFHILIARKSRM